MLPGLVRAVSAVLAALEMGDMTDGAIAWGQVDRLTKALKAAGVARPVPTPVRPRKDIGSAPDGQTDIEERIAALHVIAGHHSISRSSAS